MQRGRLSLDELRDAIEAGEIDTVLTVFPDQQGRIMGKRYTGHFFLDVAEAEWEACDYLLAMDIENEPLPGYKFASWDLGYGDVQARCDLSTIRVLPWLPATALVMCDVTKHDHPVEISPRRILQAQVDRAVAAGLKVFTASELEFYLFRETFEEAAAKHYMDLTPYGGYIEDYHILQTSKEEPVIRAIRNAMDAADIPVENSKGEWGPGQEEINLRFAEAVEMADRHVVYKNGAKEIVAQHGHSLTWMAKVRTDLAGSSFHLHSSVRSTDDDSALFWDEGGPHHMSKLMQHWVAGQLACGRAFALCYAPTINSYKRYQSGTFAPTKLVWGIDNRTCGLRVVGHSPGAIRVENRCPGADANPYVAFAATIAAGLHGIEAELELEDAYRGNAYEGEGVREVPKTLRDAIAEFEASDVARKAFGDEVVDHYAHTASLEQAEYDRRVTDFDMRRNFERI